MSKKYNREIDEKYRLENLVREQKSIIRQLNKKLRRISRGYRSYLDKDIFEEVESITTSKEIEKVCFECEKGILELKILLNRRWRECNICSYRTKVKIQQSDGSWKKM